MYLETLKNVENLINKQTDIKVKFLTRVSRELAEKLTVGQDG